MQVTGKSAVKFNKQAIANLTAPKIDFSKQIETKNKILAKANL